MTKQKKNFDPLKEAKKPEYIIDAFLISNFKLLPEPLRSEPYDMWFPEERRFLFFLDACWGNRTKDVQITEVILSEIFEVLNAPDDEYMPKGVAINMQRAISSAPAEEADAIRRQLLEMPHHKKKMKITELFEALKGYVEGDRLVEVAKQINEVMRKKLVVSGDLTAKKTQEPNNGK